jgi:phage tail sheath gpL-like
MVDKSAADDKPAKKPFTMGDRDVLVAGWLAAAIVKQGDTPAVAVEAFEVVLKTLRSKGGTGRMLAEAPRPQEIL